MRAWAGGSRCPRHTGGHFAGLSVTSDRRVLKSVTLGTQQVSFAYTVDQSGTVRIASAHPSEDADGAPATFMVRYQYDADSRLARVVKGSATQVVRVQ